MSTPDAIQDLASQLVADLAAAEAAPGTFPQEFTPAFAWQILEDVADLVAEGFTVSVIPVDDRRERISRAGFASDWEIHIAAQAHVQNDLAAVSAVVDLAKLIREWAEANAMQLTLPGGTQCSLMESGQILLARQQLKTERIASSAARLVYRVGG